MIYSRMLKINDATSMMKLINHTYDPYNPYKLMILISHIKDLLKKLKL